MFDFLKKKEKKKELTPTENLEAVSKYLATGEITEGMGSVVIRKKKIYCHIYLKGRQEEFELYCDDLDPKIKYFDDKAFGKLVNWFDNITTPEYSEDYDPDEGGFRLVRDQIQAIDFHERYYDVEVIQNGLG